MQIGTIGTGSIVETMDYKTCYNILEKTITVMDTLVKARKSAGLMF